MNQLQFSIDINTDRETVWRILWEDETFREWSGIIDPETYMKGELKEGHEVQFISAANGYGVTSLVAKLVENEYLLFKHQADTQNTGAEEREKEWTGGEESYSLSGNADTTILTVTFTVPPEQEKYFNDVFPKVIERIKELAEAKS